MNFIRFKPFYFGRIWGGSKLRDFFGRDVGDKGGSIGESWEISDRPEAESVAIGGRFDSMTLAQIIAAEPRYVMGEGYVAGSRFPVLVKWIDAAAALSVQVHPNGNAAAELGSEGKNENWFVAQADCGAKLIAGFKDGVGAIDEKSIADPEWLRANLNEFSVAAGDSVYVEGGCVHSIGAGNLILEIQENSDTTYRLYDWGRLGVDGKPRELRVRESAMSIDLSVKPEVIGTARDYAPRVICDAPRFTIEHMRLSDGEELGLAASKAKLLGVVSGGLVDAENNAVSVSENVLVPAGENAVFTAVGGCELLLTTLK